MGELIAGRATGNLVATHGTQMTTQNMSTLSSSSGIVLDEKVRILEDHPRLTAKGDTSNGRTARQFGRNVSAQASPPRQVSGRYFADLGPYSLELRIDIDGPRRLEMVSGDLFSTPQTYEGSFVIRAPTITSSPTEIQITGNADTSFTPAPQPVKVTIARVPKSQPRAVARVEFPGGTGATAQIYLAEFKSRAFRSIRLEVDRVSDLEEDVFKSYYSGLRESAGKKRRLTVQSAFAEAGVEVISSDPVGFVDIGAAGTDSAWRDAELHAAMEANFQLMANSPGNAVWLLEALLHEQGSSVYGVMIDEVRKSRLGCAVFYQGIKGQIPERRRRQLHTYIHELGHCFNLLHSWEKDLAVPPGINRLDALSWMNYPDRYPGGEDFFWKLFPFAFEADELAHIRHGFREDVLFGGNPLGGGIMSEVNPEVFDERINISSPSFRVEGAHPTYALGEPVYILLGFHQHAGGTTKIHAHFHPSGPFTRIMVEKPDRTVVAFQPYVEHLFHGATRQIGFKSIVDSAYIAYGKIGHFFDAPGGYRVRAVHRPPDGELMFSSIATLAVAKPETPEERDIAKLMLNDDQGILLSLNGSDAESLRASNNTFLELLTKYPENGVGDYIRFAMGMNACQPFKSIDPSGIDAVRVRPPAPDAVPLLTQALRSNSRLDEISKQQARRHLRRILGTHTD
jgi:hypothetical protein